MNTRTESAKVTKITKSTEEKLTKLRAMLRAAKSPMTVKALAGRFKVTRATMAKWIAMDAIRIKTGAVGLRMEAVNVREGQRGPLSSAFRVVEG
jgi:predicted DNA-binding transcriptional regulator YafY